MHEHLLTGTPSPRGLELLVLGEGVEPSLQLYQSRVINPYTNRAKLSGVTVDSNHHSKLHIT